MIIRNTCDAKYTWRTLNFKIKNKTKNTQGVNNNNSGKFKHRNTIGLSKNVNPCMLRKALVAIGISRKTTNA